VYAIAIHGGAGVLARAEMTEARARTYERGLSTALCAGQQLLEQGGSALDAVETAVAFLEADPLFNAGKGATLTSEGKAELDAAIMDGANLRAGAVAQLRHIKHPIKLARRVLEDSPHVFLVGDGAERFALEAGLDIVSPDYFITAHRAYQLDQVRLRLTEQGGFGTQARPTPLTMEEPAFGTVGAVARDRDGNIAAATSTGGMTSKLPGRVGDAPVIGAGTYADNNSCAISATGHGEWFIRTALAHDIAARMSYAHCSLEDAVNAAVEMRLTQLGGAGGVIAVDAAGTIVMRFNTAGMYRASVRDGERPLLGIY
jgi:L-asparaginase / beta-aspartyl-peptidase